MPTFTQLSRIDLNLLVSLHALLEYNSVSKAADKLHLSQSALSKNLARLREVFGDPLLVRSGYRMEPTPRANILRKELETVLAGIDRLTSPEVFSPGKSSRCFRISAVESFYQSVFRKVIAEVLLAGNELRIDARPQQEDMFGLLRKGDLDFAVIGRDVLQDEEQADLLPDGIQGYELYQNKLCCLVRQSHPCLNQAWNFDAYLAGRHVVTRSFKNEQWLLDKYLERDGFKREVALHVPDFNIAASLCASTDLIVTAPTAFAATLSSSFGLVLLPYPADYPPLVYTLYCAQDYCMDPALTWFKKMIINSCTDTSIS
jgi:DNA-binding transcriptional LysR family regulator